MLGLFHGDYMLIEDEVYLDYSDVLIKPKRSTLSSRVDVDLNKTYKFRNSEREWSGIPIIASNMSCIGTVEMAKIFTKHNMLVALSKYVDKTQITPEIENNIFYTIGFSDDDLNQLKEIENLDKICIDIANAHIQPFVHFVEKVRELFPKTILMVGNVSSPEMTQELLLAGADIIKVGIGSGSVCQTRIIAGVGVPQLSCTIKCADIAHGMNGHICSDGGIIYPGDIAKSIAGGADFVMCGGLLSGTDECYGEWEEESEVDWSKHPPLSTGKRVKKSFKFYGMSSKDAMEKYSGGVSSYRAAEGKSVKVAYKGPVENTIQEILGGLRSACTYAGAWRLKDLSKCCTFIRVNNTHNKVFE